MVAGVLTVSWHRPRGLRHPETHPLGQHLLVDSGIKDHAVHVEIGLTGKGSSSP